MASTATASSQPPAPPEILAGPIVRRLTPRRLVLWLVTSRPLDFSLALFRQDSSRPFLRVAPGDLCQPRVRLGRRAFVQLVDLTPDSPLPVGERIGYDLLLTTQDGSREEGLADLAPDLLYAGRQRPDVVVCERIRRLLHGSCRKPHHPGGDGLARADALLRAEEDPARRPALLALTGDQVYVDDVAGPMLHAIHQVVECLELFPERLTGAEVADSDALYADSRTFYQRELLLPDTRAGRTLADILFGGVRKPVFTTDTAHNHLITLAEMTAMYLLVWSPRIWDLVSLEPAPAAMQDPERRARFDSELEVIAEFAAGVGRAARALAHLPVAMIFDDHEVSDDWNLTRAWEEAAYEQPFSRRILGNALFAYWLFQGWGNDPARFDEPFLQAVRSWEADPGGPRQDAMIDRLLAFGGWHYSLPTTPKVVVLDTRTHRWGSETNAHRPSGLMDWEALSDLQQELVNEPAVILISPTPIFGVKVIEIVQRIFTYFGQALMVDAENWMAHRGTASVILNILQNPATPGSFVILSGDVHYSLAYDVELRSRKDSPDIWQITCSGLRNEFPPRLLAGFERLNRWLFGSRSPLNWLTRRRRMKIHPRQVQGREPVELYNRSALGLVELDDDGNPTRIEGIDAATGERVIFRPTEPDASR